MSETQPDPVFFNNMIYIPPQGLNELLYCRPQNNLISPMEDDARYAKYKVIGLISSRSSMEDDLNNTDNNSDQSVMIYQKGFGESPHLSSDTLHKFFEILPYCIPINSNLHAQTKTVMLRIFGACVLHPYRNGLFQRCPLYNTGLHIAIVLMSILYFL